MIRELTSRQLRLEQKIDSLKERYHELTNENAIEIFNELRELELEYLRRYGIYYTTTKERKNE
jgi:hypothetical protein